MGSVRRGQVCSAVRARAHLFCFSVRPLSDCGVWGVRDVRGTGRAEAGCMFLWIGLRWAWECSVCKLGVYVVGEEKGVGEDHLCEWRRW